MVHYHLIIKGHLIQLGSGEPQAGPGQFPDNNNNTNINNNIFGASYKITIKSHSHVPYKVVPH